MTPDFLQWLNLLLLPVLGLLWRVNTRLATVEAHQVDHGRRLADLEGRAAKGGVVHAV